MCIFFDQTELEVWLNSEILLSLLFVFPVHFRLYFPAGCDGFSIIFSKALAAPPSATFFDKFFSQGIQGVFSLCYCSGSRSNARPKGTFCPKLIRIPSFVSDSFAFSDVIIEDPAS